MESSELPRRCSRCGKLANCVDVTRLALEGIFPSGTIFTYACSACGNHFKVDSAWRTIVSVLYTTPLFGLAGLVGWVAFVKYRMNPFEPQTLKQTDWAVLGVGGAMFLAGLAALTFSIWRVIQRVRNPVVDPS
jgi:hypothetical protein